MSRRTLRSELRKRGMFVTGSQLPDDRDKVVEMLRLWEWDNWLKANPTFHRFRDFPAEIQLMVFQLWENRGPRLIHLKIGSEPNRVISFPTREFEVGLQLCRLSRSSITAKACESFGIPGLYADLQTDALIIDGWDIYTNLRLLVPREPVNREERKRKADMRRVQHIVLPYEFMKAGFTTHPEFADMLISRGLRLFNRLKTLSFVYGAKEYWVDVLGPRRTSLAPNPIDEEQIDDPWFLGVLKIIRESEGADRLKIQVVRIQKFCFGRDTPGIEHIAHWSYLQESYNPPYA
ncbi:hypothetical protein ACMFMG_009528 [Clarireedia jacksonii]